MAKKKTTKKTAGAKVRSVKDVFHRGHKITDGAVNAIVMATVKHEGTMHYRAKLQPPDEGNTFIPLDDLGPWKLTKDNPKETKPSETPQYAAAR